MLFLSCDVAGGLFSQSELADMYEVWIDSDGIALGDGDLVHTDSSFVPVIESPGSVSDPGKLTLILVDQSGTEAARLTFMAKTEGDQGSDDPSVRAVGSLRGKLPAFSFPDDLAEGYYSLETRLYDSSGRMLSDSSTLVLVYNGIIPAPRIETFPSSPAKGQPVFLRLVSDLPNGFDPWLRWYVGGGLRKEGYASDFADRLIWQVPESDGFFSVRAELFPFKPPVEVLSRTVPILRPRLSAFRADLILAVGSAQGVSFFTGIDQAYSVDFKSDPETQKVAMRDGSSLPLVTIGSPYAESHEYGYGHALTAGSGYLIPGSILPAPGTPLTLSVALDPMDTSDPAGAILGLYEADDSSPFLQLGISGELLYLEAGDHRVQARVAFPPGLSHLDLEVVPSGSDSTKALVSLFLNNERVGTGTISADIFSRPGPLSTLVAGPEGYSAVYEAFAVVHGRYQAFLSAKTQEFGSSLVAASGFEGGTLGRGISVLGSAKAEDGYIALTPETALEIPVPASGFTVDIEGYGAPPALECVMDDGSRVAFAVATGWQASLNQVLSVSVEAVEGGLRIHDDAGRNLRIPTSLSVVALRVQPDSSGPLNIQSIMVRTLSPLNSLVRVALAPLVQHPGGSPKQPIESVVLNFLP